MADNKTLPFTGDGDATSTVATDEIGGVDYQRVKMTLGADGVNDGDVSDENPLPAKTAVVAHGRLTSLMQTRRDWRSILVKSNGDVIACVYGGGIYLQTAGVGDFVDTGETSRYWFGLCEDPDGNVYASVYSGDIYIQTAGSGAFVGLGETHRDWCGMCVNPVNGDVYAAVYGGDIYVRAGGSGSFTALGETTRNWVAICADSQGNVWATANTGIYKRTLGSGSFATISVPATIGAAFAAIAVARDGSYLYAADLSALRIIVIPVQYDSTAILNVAQQIVQNCFGLAVSGDGKLYATTSHPFSDMFYADLGFALPGDFAKTKVNRNRAQAVYLEDWDIPGRGVRVGEFGGVRAETGHVPHDYPAKESVGYAEVRPTLIGGYASAAAPTDVSADGDAVRAWHLRNGAQATVLTAAGALIGGDATNGLDVDVTRVPTDPFGANADAAVVTDAVGSISAKLRGLVKLIAERIPVIGQNAKAASMSVVTASDDDMIGSKTETAPASDTASSGINGRLQRIAQRLTSLIAAFPAALGQAASAGSLSVTVASDQTPVPVGNTVAQSTASFTRPADTTAYAIGDVVCNSTSAPVVLTFSNMARVNGGVGVLAAFQMVLGTNPATKPTYDLMLFDTAPTIDNDNAQFTPTDSEMLKFVGRITLSVPTVGDTSGTGTSCVYTSDAPLVYKCDAGSTSLYGVLVARNAVTPSSADTYNFKALVQHLN